MKKLSSSPKLEGENILSIGNRIIRNGVEIRKESRFSNHELLNLEEHKYIVTKFIELFDELFSIYNETDQLEIVRHLEILMYDYRIYKCMNLQVLEHWNSVIFGNSVLRDFYLEINNRLAAEVTPLGNDSYTRLINTLSYSLEVSHSNIDESSSKPENFVLISISTGYEEARKIYFSNTWIVGLNLLARYFKKTQLGQG